MSCVRDLYGVHGGEKKKARGRAVRVKTANSQQEGKFAITRAC